MISIIIPFNNGKKYLKNCLENLIKIEYEDFEVILIDDFSEDNSDKIAIEFSDLNIKYYYTEEKTIGVGNARNLGIEKANGKYIMFLDVDDLIEKDLLNKLQPYIDQDIDMIKYKMKIITNEKEEMADGPVFDITGGETAFNNLCFEDKFLDSPCLYLIKKELIKRNNLQFEKNVHHEDFGLIPSLIVNSRTFVSTNYYGYKYIQTEESIMRNDDYENKIRKVNDKFILYTKLYKNLNIFNLKNETKENMLEFYINSILTGIKELKIQDRKKFIKRMNKRGLINNIKIRNVKQLIKKIALKLNIIF